MIGSDRILAEKDLSASTVMHFVHASDEWYLLAGRPLPEEERYDGYLQLENGVGMLRLLENGGAQREWTPVREMTERRK